MEKIKNNNVLIEEFEGLAVNLVELDEMHYKLVEQNDYIKNELEDLEKRINNLQILEEEE